MLTVPIKLIGPSPNPVRKEWDEDKMQELAASIKEHGIIVPIKVRPAVYWCDICDEGFSEPGLHHCPKCAHHYPDDECSNCHRDNSAVPVMQPLSVEYVLGGGDLVIPPYEIVYGHRRVEAARRAGLEEVPAIIEQMDNREAEEEALIENVTRADLHPLEEARAMYEWYKPVEEFGRGWTMEKIGQVLGKKVPWVHRRIALLEETEQTQSLIGLPGLGVKPVFSDGKMEPLGEYHIRSIRDAGIADVKEREQIAVKAYEEQLTSADTRAVADAYKAAPTPELKDAVLNTSGKLGDADRILEVARMKVGVNNMTERHEVERRQAFEEYDRAVKDFLDFVKLSNRMVKTARDAARYGKFSPEGARFAIGRIDALIEEFTALKDALSSVE